MGYNNVIVAKLCAIMAGGIPSDLIAQHLTGTTKGAIIYYE